MIIFSWPFSRSHSVPEVDVTISIVFSSQTNCQIESKLDYSERNVIVKTICNLKYFVYVDSMNRDAGLVLG